LVFAQANPNQGATSSSQSNEQQRERSVPGNPNNPGPRQTDDVAGESSCEAGAQRALALSFNKLLRCAGCGQGGMAVVHIRANQGYARSTLEKTLEANRYKRGALAARIDEPAGDGVITAARARAPTRRFAC
jgi:hypothetical protein